MSWRTEYLVALQARDSQEQINKDVFEAYTQLADKAAALARGPIPAKDDRVGLCGAGSAVATVTTTAMVRQDLVEAQRSRGEVETRLRAVTIELDKLQLKSKAESLRISELTAERIALSKKLRDRDEELQGKSKLLENVHDETLSLTIELNMVEKQNKKLQVENKELVDRWMARKGQEADAMNLESKF